MTYIAEAGLAFEARFWVCMWLKFFFNCVAERDQVGWYIALVDHDGGQEAFAGQAHAIQIQLADLLEEIIVSGGVSFGFEVGLIFMHDGFDFRASCLDLEQ